jgi:uroporphyrin-3 C-methyltransferase
MTETENMIEQEIDSVPPEAKNRKSSKAALLIALLSLFLIILLAAAAFYFYKENKALVETQQQQLTALSESVASQSSLQNTQSRQTSEIKSSVEAQIEKVNQQLQQAENQNKIIKTDIQSLQRSFAATNIRHPNDWILSEVEYLVALSGRKIWLEGDIKTAVALLIAADQRIVELNDASLSPLRAALLEDVNNLEALPRLDSDGAILAITSLERRVNKLRTNSLLMPEKSDSQSAEVSSDIAEWDANLIKSWDEFLDSFITINKRDSRIEALLSPEQSWYLQEHLRSNLAKAEFAIYREQQDVYDIAMDNTIALLENYYDLKDKTTEHFYNSVMRLSKRKVSIKYPDQLKSAPLLERVLEQRLKKSLASSTLK